MNITQLFGSNAALDTTTASNPILSTDFDSVKAAASWDTAPTSGTDSGAKWLLAIIQTAKAAIALVTDGSNNVTISDPTLSVQTINGQLTEVRTFQVTFRKPYTGSATPDADDF